MSAENIDLQMRIISKLDFERHYEERLPPPALSEGIDYTFAALLEKATIDALTITARLTFLEHEQGRLAIKMYFLNNTSYDGYLLDDGAWLPDSNAPLRFTNQNNHYPVIKGCFVAPKPDGITEEMAKRLSAFVRAKTPI